MPRAGHRVRLRSSGACTSTCWCRRTSCTPRGGGRPCTRRRRRWGRRCAYLSSRSTSTSRRSSQSRCGRPASSSPTSAGTATRTASRRGARWRGLQARARGVCGRGCSCTRRGCLRWAWSTRSSSTAWTTGSGRSPWWGSRASPRQTCCRAPRAARRGGSAARRGSRRRGSSQSPPSRSRLLRSGRSSCRASRAGRCTGCRAAPSWEGSCPSRGVRRTARGCPRHMSTARWHHLVSTPSRNTRKSTYPWR
mmetsp:Transcript_34081/g.79839  ORF Transcript_34081/g.79839 Transcript_34081/m.79839 type:complete len:250 (+) Transcript_34081:747-1496(+)